MSATNRGAVRQEFDFYPTPVYCTELLIKTLDEAGILLTNKTILEPCNGEGSISNVILDNCKCNIITNDVNPAAIEYNQFPYDYLSPNGVAFFKEKDVDIIITNPPFSLAQECIQVGFEICRYQVHLLRLNFLGSQKRKEFWDQGKLKYVWTLSKRPRFIPGTSGDSTEYAWFVFDRNHNGPYTGKVI